MGVSRKRSSTLNLWKNFNENWDILKPAFLTYYKCKHEGSINFPTSQIGPVWVRVIFKRWGRRWCVFKQIAKDIYYENVHTTCLALKKIWRIICTSILKVNHSWRKKGAKMLLFLHSRFKNRLEHSLTDRSKISLIDLYSLMLNRCQTRICFLFSFINLFKWTLILILRTAEKL